MAEQTYIRVRWRHQLQSEPVDLWSELDGQRYELRKLEYFCDGSVRYADRTAEVGGARLGTLPVPPLEIIAADPEFLPELISKVQFEDRWNQRFQPSSFP